MGKGQSGKGHSELVLAADRPRRYCAPGENARATMVCVTMQGRTATRPCEKISCLRELPEV